jgi:Zn-dependent protease
MLPTQRGAFRLFRWAGIDVFLHWSWLIVAFVEIEHRQGEYGSLVWNVAEYLALFAIVLCHEFGHSLACRQVGGEANQIILWPLGGVAYVDPPQRPGPMLWSIAAGPLVNVGFALIFFGIPFGLNLAGVELDLSANLKHFCREVTVINLVLLGFNLLPIYPLDGGQILRSLLWFVIGRARSVLVVSVIGSLGGLGVILLAWEWKSIWTGVLAFFMLSRSVQGFRGARMMGQQPPAA